MSSIPVDTGHGKRASFPSIVEVGLLAFAAYQFAVAALMVFAPHVFFTNIGPFGTQNNHYLRDTATYNAAFGAALLVAYKQVSWRTPVLACLALQFILHSINHLADVGAAHPHWLGPADFISLSLATAVLVWLARESTRPLEVQR
ncbi:MAG TPA: hypothetical protein VNX67_06250 [Solirubrobacteraceae bacterium]|jgi:hypothetical protein|nr:hypothetical protein [Solirubrobacteraceae bacterium]